MSPEQHTAVVLVVLIVSLCIAATFAAAFRGRGVRIAGDLPVFVIFYMPVFLASWAGALWFAAAGPMFWGVAWIPIIAVGLATALIMASFSLRQPEVAHPGHGLDDTAPVSMRHRIGAVFWAALVIFSVLLISGLLRA